MSNDIKILIEDEYIEYTKGVLKSSKETLPTLKLQLISLVRFMRVAGYEPVNPDQPTRFKLVEDKPKFPRDVSLVNAVKMHNFGFFYETTEGYVVPFMFTFDRPARVLEDACKAKVVQEVYLQWNKKRRDWVVNKHQVKFVEEE